MSTTGPDCRRTESTTSGRDPSAPIDDLGAGQQPKVAAGRGSQRNRGSHGFQVTVPAHVERPIRSDPRRIRQIGRAKFGSLAPGPVRPLVEQTRQPGRRTGPSTWTPVSRRTAPSHRPTSLIVLRTHLESISCIGHLNTDPRPFGSKNRGLRPRFLLQLNPDKIDRELELTHDGCDRQCPRSS